MKNPLSVLRKEAGFNSPKQFAEYLGVSPSSIEQAEYATPTNIPETFLRGLLQRDQSVIARIGYADLATLQQSYEQFQNYTRQANFGTLILDPDFRPTEHPLISWRLQSGGLSLHAISRAYCIHLGQLNKFELQPWTFKNIMPSLDNSLRISGYGSYKMEGSLTILDYFKGSFTIYKENIKSLMERAQ